MEVSVDYQKLLTEMSYTDIAHELGCCELTVRNKLNGKSRITKPEKIILDRLIMEKEKNNHVRFKRTETNI